jgi:hypothetical protein
MLIISGNMVDFNLIKAEPTQGSPYLEARVERQEEGVARSLGEEGS